MKNWICLLVVYCLMACDRDSESLAFPLSLREIVGSWQLIETYTSPGGSAEWVPVEDGPIFTFGLGGSYQNTEGSKGGVLQEGTFTLEDNLLVLVHVLDGQEVRENFWTDLSGDNMILSPAGPVMCIEPCLSRYQKIQ